MAKTNLNIPRPIQQLQVYREPLLLHQLLPQHIWITPRIARNVTNLLHIGQRNQFHALVLLEHGFEALHRRVHGATQGRGRYQLDLVMMWEVVAEDPALLVAEIGQRGVVDDMVCGADVVETLLLSVGFLFFPSWELR